MAEGSNWQCPSCGSENLAADAVCGTCSRARDLSAAPLASSPRAMRVEDQTQRALGAPTSQRPLGAAATPAAPPYPPPVYAAPPGAPPFPAHAQPSGPTAARTAIGWLASLAILAGLYFGYRYLQEHPLNLAAAPGPQQQFPQAPQPTSPFGVPQQPNPAASDYSTWAVAASTPELRAAISAAGPNAAAAAAELRVREQTAWQRVDSSATIESVVAYLSAWPDSSQQAAARGRLNELLANLDMRDVPQATSSQNSNIYEAPVASARTIGQVRANQVLSGEGIVRYGGRQWIVTRTSGRRGYVDSSTFRVYRAEAPASEPTPPPRPTPNSAPPPNVIVRPAERLTDPAQADYPARARGQTGEVFLSFTVTASGQVRDIRVTSENPPGLGFAQAATNAMRSVRYRARREDGRAVESRETLRMIIRPPS